MRLRMSNEWRLPWHEFTRMLKDPLHTCQSLMAMLCRISKPLLLMLLTCLGSRNFLIIAVLDAASSTILMFMQCTKNSSTSIC